MSRLAIWVLLMLGAALSGCTRDRPLPSVEHVDPPSGTGRYTDGEGQVRTVFEPIGYLSYGQSDTGALRGPSHFIGYEFDARSGDTPRIEISGEGQLQATLYGPRGETGLWEQRLESVRDLDTVVMDHEVATTGSYFVLLQSLNANGAFTISLVCEGCQAPSCDAVEPCDRVCAGGFEFDEAGCRLCACQDDVCEGVDCAAGQVCHDGECVESCRCDGAVSPVCGTDGVTYGNACRAACADVAIVSPGRCPESNCEETGCPEGQACEDGACVPLCDCPAGRQEVCGVSGATYGSACQAECVGDRIDYTGRCVERRCEGPEDGRCREGQVCAPALQVPENRARCLEGQGPCVHACMIAPPPPTRCDAEHPCSGPAFCYQPDRSRAGRCMPPCDDGRGGGFCPSGLVCAHFDASSRGVCLEPCNDDRMCGDDAAWSCAPDARETPVCQPGCGCRPGEPVCVDGRTFASACHARCAGADAFSEGACDGEQAPCDACDYSTLRVCAEGVVRANACEATCQDLRPQRVAECFDAPVQVACRVDADCFRSGCDESLCVSERTEACGALSDEAACVSRLGSCGCVENQCHFKPSRAHVECVDAVRAQNEGAERQRP